MANPNQENKFTMNMPTYPSNPEAEVSVLSAIMIDREIALELLPRLSPDFFFEVANRTIFEAMYELDSTSRNLDFVNLIDVLRVGGNLEKAGGIENVLSLKNALPSSVLAGEHYDILKRMRTLRALLDASKRITESVYIEGDADKTLALSQDLIMDIAKEKVGSTLKPLRDVMGQVMLDYEDQIRNGKSTGVKTEFWNLDAVMHGLNPGDVMVLAARPGVGKTAFVLNIAKNVAEADPRKKVLIFSLEMSDTQLAKRILSSAGQVSHRGMLDASLGENDFIRMHSAISKCGRYGIYLDDTAESNPSQIAAKCRQFSMREGLDLIIIDYLQLMAGDGTGKNDNRQNEVSKISRQIKLLAKQLRVPVIVLSQLSRDSEKNKEKPDLHHLRDSGAIEQDADVVMFLHKEKNQPKEDTIVECIIAKYRAGETGSVAFQWLGDMMTFVPAPSDRLYSIQHITAETVEAAAQMPKTAKVEAEGGLDASQFKNSVFNGGN